MSMAYYVVLNGEHGDIDTLLSGKALGHSDETLKEAAVKLCVTPLGDFYSSNWEEDREFVAAIGGDPECVPMVPEQWFSPSDGLNTVRAIREFVGQHPDRCEYAEGVIEDLNAFERVLLAADAAGLMWHLAVDF